MRKPTLQKRTASLEWDDLRCVLAIARAGSLSGAARALAVEQELPWLGFDESLSYLAIARWQRAQSARSPRVRFGSLASMMQATVEGLGVAILPLFAAERQTGLVRLGAVLDQPRMKLWVLSHKEVRHNARVKALSGHLTREIPRVLSARQKIAPSSAASV